MSSFFRRMIIAGVPISILMGSVSALSIGGRTPNLSYCDLYLSALSFACLLRLLAGYKGFVFDRKIAVLSFFYLLAIAISMTANNSDPYKGILAVTTFISGAAAYFVVLSLCRDQGDLDWSLDSLVVFGAAIAVLLVEKYSLGHDLESRLTKDSVGLDWGRSNYLAAFLALLIPISAGVAVAKKRLLTRAFFFGCSAAMVFALAITMSRGAMLSLAVGLLLVPPATLRAKSKVKYVVGLAAAAAAGFLLLPRLLPEKIMDLNRMLFDQRLSAPDADRLDMYRSAFAAFCDHPLLGIGAFASASVAGRSITHNYVLQVLSELGLFGGIAFMSILGLFLRRAHRNYSLGRGDLDCFIFAGVVTTLLHGLVELTFQGEQYMVVFWMLMAVVFLRGRALKEARSC